MVYYRDNLANISLKAVCQKAENDLESARKAELLTRNEEKTFLRVNTFLENIWLKMEGITQAECDIYEKVKEAFSREADDLEKQTETVAQTLQNVFDFMEAAFGDSQPGNGSIYYRIKCKLLQYLVYPGKWFRSVLSS